MMEDRENMSVPLTAAHQQAIDAALQHYEALDVHDPEHDLLNAAETLAFELAVAPLSLLDHTSTYKDRMNDGLGALHHILSLRN